MNKTEKSATIESLRTKMSKANFAVVMEYKKLDAFAAIDLRKAMRAGQLDYIVVKNTLAQIAAKGTSLEKMSAQFKGPIAVALGYSESVGHAKTAVGALKKLNDKIVIKGGVIDGETVNAQSIDELSKMLALPELRSQLLALINTPASQIARALQAHVDKSEAPAE